MKGILVARRLAIALFAVAVAASASDADKQVLDQFMASPTAHLFPDSGLKWITRRLSLTAGELTASGCHYSTSMTIAPKAASYTRETIAVDPANCKMLTAEGQLDPESQAALKVIEKSAKQMAQKTNKTSNGSSVSAADASGGGTPHKYTSEYALTYTDGNNPIIKATGNIYEFEAAAALTTEEHYRGGIEADDGLGCIADTGNPPPSQLTAENNSANPGFFGWSVTEKHSCDGTALGSPGWFLWALTADQNTSSFPSGVSPFPQSYCQKFVKTATITRNCYTTTKVSKYISGLDAKFYNNSYIVGIFDCRAGLTIVVDSATINTDIFNNVSAIGSWSYEGGADGALGPCKSNLKAIENLTQTITDCSSSSAC